MLNMTEKQIIKNYREGKKDVVKKEKKGETVDRCATYGKQYVCCNVHVIKSVSNCPYDCSYCFLQNYLNDGTMSVVDDTQAMIDEVKEKQPNNPGVSFD